MNLYVDGHLGLIRLTDQELSFVFADIANTGKGEVLGTIITLAEQSISDEANQRSVDQEGQCGQGQAPRVGCTAEESAQSVHGSLFDRDGLLNIYLFGDHLFVAARSRLSRAVVRLGIVVPDGCLGNNHVNFINQVVLGLLAVARHESRQIDGEECEDERRTKLDVLVSLRLTEDTQKLLTGSIAHRRKK